MWNLGPPHVLHQQPNGSRMTPQRHTEFAPFMFDLLDFIEEKLGEGIADDACQAGSVSEAVGVRPLLRDRLREDEVVQAQFILVFSDYLYGPHAVVLSQSRPDDLIVAPHDCYGGTHRLLTMRRDRGQFNVAFVDQSDDSLLTSTLKRFPSLVLIETPSNPLMRVVDIRAIALQAKAVGAKVAVDNTFLSPALQSPIALGADFVIHSTTKYLNGHSDIVGGAVIAAGKVDVEALSAWANITG